MRLRSICVAAVALGMAVCVSSAAFAAEKDRRGTWVITKSAWSEADENGFSDFVRAIGESGCTTSVECIEVAGNRYRDSDPATLKFIADCADFAYMLRAYYAWKNGLPFGYVSSVTGSGADIRYEGGNTIASRRDLIDKGNGLPALDILQQIHSGVWTASFRTDPGEADGLLSDFYSPKLQRGTIRPGTAVYDTNGHVGIVYNVQPDGRIEYVDAHPDFTVTRGTYGAQFGQSPARLGGGLKNWRPLKLVDAENVDGRLIGGHIVLAKNEEIADFSMEQYRGNVPGTAGDGENARFAYNGIELGLYEYLRVAMAGDRVAFNPVYELRVGMRALCRDLKERALTVDMAVRDGISRKAQPAHLPNISNANNLEWEAYSTPSRDARIKVGFAELYIDLQKLISYWENRDPRVVYDGHDLKADLQRAYAEETADCSITYVNSLDRPVTLSFEDVGARLFAIDFDPYHCIERRWGASGAELESCSDGEMKARRYEAEQRLRNQTGRAYQVQMGFSVVQPERAVEDSGADEPPAIDVKGLIDRIGERVPFVMKPVGR